MNINLFVVIIVSYLAGSIPSSLWVSKLFYKMDIRTQGSGNMGLTNIYRVLGWKATVPVAIGDLGKGLLAVWLGSSLQQTVLSPDNFALVTGLISVFGHSFTCFAGFKGGKGVLTAFAVYLFLVPFSALGAFGIWVVVLMPSGYVSLASISAALALSVFVLFEYYLNGSGSLLMIILTIFLSSFVIYRHRSNISRLLMGKENRFGKKRI